MILIIPAAFIGLAFCLCWSAAGMAAADWQTSALIALCFTLALYGRSLMRRCAGLKQKTTPPVPARKKTAPLILSLANSGALTNGRPLATPRQKLNTHQQRS